MLYKQLTNVSSEFKYSVSNGSNIQVTMYLSIDIREVVIN
jgi:hypothetical protein